MNLYFKLTCLFSFSILSGCLASYDGQPHNYSGKNLEGLLNARSQCVSELSGSNANGVNVNVNVNSYSAQPNYSCAELNTCVATKGYLRTPEGSISLPKSFVLRCTQ